MQDTFRYDTIYATLSAALTVQDDDTPRPPGWLEPWRASAQVASGAAVWFEDLLRTGDLVKITTDAQGAKFYAFGERVFQTVAERCPAGKQLAFGRDGGGTYEINTPGWSASGGVADSGAFRMPKQCAGLVGLTPPGDSLDRLTLLKLRTVFRVKPNTAPAKNVPGGWFQIGFSGSTRFDIANIHFEGTEQGMQTPAGTGVNGGPGNDGTSQRIFTNVFAYNMADGCTARDILSTGNYGNNGAPPGESFLFQWYGSTNGVLCRVAVDGRREAGGPIYGAAGITFGNALNCIAIECTAHHCGQAGFVGYQAVNCTTYDLVLGDSDDHKTVHVNKITNLDWLNHERTAGFVHYRTVFNTVNPSAKQREPITHSGDAFVLNRGGKSYPTASGTLELIDPVYKGLLFSGKISIAQWNPYGSAASTHTGKVVPIVRKADGTKIPYKLNYGTGWTDQ